MILYQFQYTSCVEESAFATISIHFSSEGAEKALEEHKQLKKEEWDKMCKWDENEEPLNEFSYRNICPFGVFERWIVTEIEVLP